MVMVVAGFAGCRKPEPPRFGALTDPSKGCGQRGSSAPPALGGRKSAAPPLPRSGHGRPGHTELNDGTNGRATSLSPAGVPPPLALASWEPGGRDAAGLHFPEGLVHPSWIPLGARARPGPTFDPIALKRLAGRLRRARGPVAATV